MTTVSIATVNTPHVFTGKPTIDGFAQAGRTLNLIDLGTYDADNDSIAMNFQWKVDGTDISGATVSNYTLTMGDKSKEITCTLTLQDSYGGVTEYTTNGTVVTKFRWQILLPGLIAPKEALQNF